LTIVALLSLITYKIYQGHKNITTEAPELKFELKNDEKTVMYSILGTYWGLSVLGLILLVFNLKKPVKAA
tara:strand:+ start:17056 stop:17265 length:210 start_codon:yes stop_codon:yes gene_type:complete